MILDFIRTAMERGRSKISQHVIRNVAIVVLAITNALLGGAGSMSQFFIPRSYINLYDRDIEVWPSVSSVLLSCNKWISVFFSRPSFCADLWWVVSDNQATTLDQTATEASAGTLWSVPTSFLSKVQTDRKGMRHTRWEALRPDLRHIWCQQPVGLFAEASTSLTLRAIADR